MNSGTRRSFCSAAALIPRPPWPSRRGGSDLRAELSDTASDTSTNLSAPRKVAQYFNVVEHVTFDVNIGAVRRVRADGRPFDVPKDRAMADMEKDIPVTYVPARNTVFLSIALAWAETLGANDIFIGVNALDYSGYPDCRPEYIEAFEKMANLATKAGVEGRQTLRIHTPLIQLTKAANCDLGRDLASPSGSRVLATTQGRGRAMWPVRRVPAPIEGIPRSWP